jgi:UDP-2-acetamido-2-deoxy-ribo-hexuluronate aminotransferase
MAFGIGQGDEVITTPFTFFAAVEAIKILGATPVFVDIDPKSYNLNPELLEARISDRTKAILPVSLYGQCPDMDRINEIADSYQIPVIEDAAQSFGATYKGRRSCSLSQIGCTSFFPAKPFGAYGDAGACFTEDNDLAESMRQVRDHGQSGRYQHCRIGLNGRMDTIQAAVLLAKMVVFDQELASRTEAARRYTEQMKSAELSQLLTLPAIEPHNSSSWAQYTVGVSDRNYVQSVLSANGIPTAVHYPEPVYAQPALSEVVAHCPETEHAARRVLSLPMHPYLESDTQNFVSRLLLEALKL